MFAQTESECTHLVLLLAPEVLAGRQCLVVPVDQGCLAGLMVLMDLVVLGDPIHHEIPAGPEVRAVLEDLVLLVCRQSLELPAHHADLAHKHSVSVHPHLLVIILKVKNFNFFCDRIVDFLYKFC